MHGRRDSLVGASKLVVELDRLAHSAGGYTTATNIQSGPVGSCNIQSNTKLVFCLMHQELRGLENMGLQIMAHASEIASTHGLTIESSRILISSLESSGRRQSIVYAVLVVRKV
jgi:N-carbamoyl-L-amino-acid hydrolase